MPLPDLSLVAHLLATFADATPAAPPSPVALPADWAPLRDILINLGGWGALLWSLFSAGVKRLETFGSDVTARLETMGKELKAFRRELRRIRHAPPPEAYRDGPPSTHPPRPTPPPA